METNGEMKEIREGSASILVQNDKEVFYNKVQSRNRDLTILVLNIWGEEYLKEDQTMKRKERRGEKGLKVLEALAATGLRSIRFAKEVPCLGTVVANDLDENAVETIKMNIKRNGVEDLVEGNCSDATLYMANHREEFDVVDIDPYGSPAIFLDSAINCVAHGGLLCVTATDMAVLCGNHPETCFARYHSVPLKAQFCHEMALRMILYSIQTTAAKYGLTIVPLFCSVMEFYVRAFVRVYRSKSSAKRAITDSSYVLYCGSCESFHMQPIGDIVTKDVKPQSSGKTTTGYGRHEHIVPNLKYAPAPLRTHSNGSCSICGSKIKIAGPIYTSKINDMKFVDAMIASLQDDAKWKFDAEKRLKAILTGIKRVRTTTLWSIYTILLTRE